MNAENFDRPVTVPQLLAQVNEAMVDSMIDMATPLLDLLRTTSQARSTGRPLARSRATVTRKHPRGCMCDECCGCKVCDPCRCCIGDADVVIYARPGESRVIPFEVVNSRVRDREVTVQLGEFKTCDGKDLGIVAQVIPSRLKLAPCSEGLVHLFLKVPVSSKTLEAVNAESAEERKRLTATKIVDAGRKGLDICGCEVLYANLAFDGCRTRPLTLALAILDVDCSPHEINCSACCC